MFFKVKELATEYRVDENTIYKWISEGKIRANKIGGALRISKEAKKEFEDKSEVKGGDAKTKD